MLTFLSSKIVVKIADNIKLRNATAFTSQMCYFCLKKKKSKLSPFSHQLQNFHYASIFLHHSRQSQKDQQIAGRQADTPKPPCQTSCLQGFGCTDTKPRAAAWLSALKTVQKSIGVSPRDGKSSFPKRISLFPQIYAFIEHCLNYHSS